MFPLIDDSFRTIGMIAVFLIIGLAGYYFSLRYSRHQEYRADAYALQATGQVQSFKSAMVRLVKINLMHVNVVHHLSSHPTLAQRLRHADEFAARQSGLSRPLAENV